MNVIQCCGLLMLIVVNQAAGQLCLYNYTIGAGSPVIITQSAPVCLICSISSNITWNITSGNTISNIQTTKLSVLNITTPLSAFIAGPTVGCYTVGAVSYVASTVFIAAPVVPQVVTYVNESDTLNLDCSKVITVSSGAIALLGQSWLNSQYNAISNTSTIFISLVNRTAAGNYTCVTKLVPNANEVSTVTASTMVVVYYSPSIQSSQSTLYAVSGSSIQLSCTVDGLPVPTIVWTSPNGRAIVSQSRFVIRFTTTSTSLIISSVRDVDNGTYTCIASNIRGTASSTIQLLVWGNMSISGNGTTPTAGLPFTIICTVVVIGWNGPLTIQLTAPNSTTLARNMSVGMTYTLQRSFSYLRTSDGGQYFCIAIGYNFSSNSSLTLIVSAPPPKVNLIAAPIASSYNAGTPLNLTCTVQLIAQVDTPVILNFTWTGLRGKISSNAAVGRVALFSSAWQSTVQFYPLNTTDTGAYNCSVSVANSLQYVIYQSAESFYTIVVNALPSPQVTFNSSGSPTAGRPYTLTCTVILVNGLVVVPQVTWLYNGVNVLKENKSLSLNRTVSLNKIILIIQFNNISTSNGGQYFCMVNVSIPVISITQITRTLFNVTVKISPPDVTVTAVPSHIVIEGNNLTLLCKVTLDPSVDSPVIVNTTWTGTGGATFSGSNPLRVGSSSQSTLMLASLGAGSAGNYTCGVSVIPTNSQYITGPISRDAFISVLVQTSRISSVGPSSTVSITSSSPTVNNPISSLLIGSVVGAFAGGILSVLVVIIIIATTRLAIRALCTEKFVLPRRSDSTAVSEMIENLNLTTINATENVCYGRVCVSNQNHSVYETIPGEYDSQKSPSNQTSGKKEVRADMRATADHYNISSSPTIARYYEVPSSSTSPFSPDVDYESVNFKK